MSKVIFKRKRSNEIENLPVEDGSLIFDIEKGESYIDYGNNRIKYSKLPQTKETNSDNDTYSCNYINKLTNYSSEEQYIGDWFGEKHYRKVFEIDMDSNLKQMIIPTGIDMKQLTHAYGVALHDGTIYLPLNFYNDLGWDTFHLTGKGSNIILQRGDNFPITKVFITLEYTKNV